MLLSLYKNWMVLHRFIVNTIKFRQTGNLILHLKQQILKKIEEKNSESCPFEAFLGK